MQNDIFYKNWNLSAIAKRVLPDSNVVLLRDYRNSSPTVCVFIQPDEYSIPLQYMIVDWLYNKITVPILHDEEETVHVKLIISDRSDWPQDGLNYIGSSPLPPQLPSGKNDE